APITLSPEPQETPPRAWGRLVPVCRGDGALGNTPTGVGKTIRQGLGQVVLGKHPHGRGEDFDGHPEAGVLAETPPRAWGRHTGRWLAYLGMGNTPTGVGKTKKPERSTQEQRKHPHGRGEDDGIEP